MTTKIQILECTLRDGSYAIDFGFTASETANLCSALETAGFDMIEVGHGLGLGASRPEIGIAAESDEGYLRAAADALSAARFGAFYIPGIATEDHLRMARSFGMFFVRIGTNITRSEEAQRPIELARELGFEVSYNAMKSYAVPPQEFSRRLTEAAKWGAHHVYLVDSAGGMLPSEVRDYTLRLLDSADTRVGFHGHNNLGLAIANSISALEAGATLIDTTLQGMGRSSGNAQTEIFAVLLSKLGYESEIDIDATFQIGERFVRQRMPVEHGVSALDVTMGSAQFHSSFLPLIEEASEMAQVDVLRLIHEVGDIDRVNPTRELIMKVAERIAHDSVALDLSANASRRSPA